nr:hypothetical protein Q903MT_gene1611 [Picea sitchensis]
MNGFSKMMSIMGRGVPTDTPPRKEVPALVTHPISFTLSMRIHAFRSIRTSQHLLRGAHQH